MTENQVKKKRNRRRWLRLAGYISAGFLVLLLLAFGFSQTQLFRDYLRDFVVDKVNGMIHGELFIETIDGNLYSSVEVRGAALTLSGDTLAYLPRIRLEYELWPLISKRLHLEKVLLDSLQVSLIQNTDSTWNFMKIMPESSSESGAESSSGSSFLIDLDYLRFSECNITLDALDSLLPRKIEGFSLMGSGQYGSERQEIKIDSLSLRTRQPDFQIKNFMAALTRDQYSISIDTLSIQTAENKIDATARYSPGDPLTGNLLLITEPLKLNEFAAWLGEIAPKVEPEVTLHAALKDDSLIANLVLDGSEQEIKVNGRLAPFRSLSNDSGHIAAEYAIDISLDSIMLNSWISSIAQDVLAAGKIVIEGQGLDMKTASSAIRADLTMLQVDNYDLGQAALNVRYDQGDVRTSGSMTGSYGEADFDINVRDLMSLPAYQASLAVKDFDIFPLRLFDTLDSDITLTMAVQGKGFDSESLSGSCRASVQSSRIGNFSIDSLSAIFDYSSSLLNIDTFFLVTEPGSVHASGAYSLDNTADLQFEAVLGKLDDFTDYIPLGELAAEGTINGRISGKADSLETEINIRMQDIRVDSNTVDSLVFSGTLLYDKSVLTGRGSVLIRNIILSGYAIPELSVSGNIDPKMYQAEIGFSLDKEISGSLSGEYVIDSIPLVILQALTLNIGTQTWVSSQDPARIEMQPDYYVIDNFSIKESSSTTPQSIDLDGVFSPEGDQDLKLSLQNIDLARIDSAFGLPVDVSGLLTVEADLRGKLDNPRIEGFSELRDGRIHDYDFESLGGNYSILDSLLELEYTLDVHGPESLTVRGQLPLHSFLDSENESGSAALMDINVKSHGFTLDILRIAGYSVKEADGNLDIQLRAFNSISDPRFEGTIRVADGTVEAPDWGIDYTDLTAALVFDSSRITLEQLSVKQGQDSMVVSGYAGFKDGIMSGKFSQFEFSLDADKFWLVRHRDYEIRTFADVTLSTESGTPEYSGNVRIVRSSFWLPALAGKSAPKDPGSLPMLVAASRDTIVIRSEQGAENSEDNGDSFLPSEMVDALRGNLKITFQRNNWINSPDMKFEIGGELDIVKTGLNFELFGSINIIRGHYDLYGKRFRVKEGQVTFNGGPELNALLNITVEHVFRTPERDKKYLILNISGSIKEPVLAFTLDGNALSEGDAVSYLVFGRPLDELSTGRRKSLADKSGSQGSLAENVSANLVGGQLSKLLGQEFSLDIIEIKAQDGWHSASFLAGKYLTTDLFVSYQRGLGTSRADDDVIPQIVTLEYELTGNVSLQLVAGDDRSSGFDVILKLEDR